MPTPTPEPTPEPTPGWDTPHQLPTWVTTAMHERRTSWGSTSGADTTQLRTIITLTTYTTDENGADHPDHTLVLQGVNTGDPRLPHDPTQPVRWRLYLDDMYGAIVTGTTDTAFLASILTNPTPWANWSTDEPWQALRVEAWPGDPNVTTTTTDFYPGATVFVDDLGAVEDMVRQLGQHLPEGTFNITMNWVPTRLPTLNGTDAALDLILWWELVGSTMHPL